MERTGWNCKRTHKNEKAKRAARMFDIGKFKQILVKWTWKPAARSYNIKELLLLLLSLSLLLLFYVAVFFVNKR